MNFGEALDQLKLGARVYRAGWNGKGMWIVIEDTTRWPDSKMQPFIYMHTADGSLVPWVASQTDILATDWLIRFERPTPEANRWLNDVRIEHDGAASASEPTPTAPSATTAAQDAGITLTVHLDGKVLYDAIRPHAERARQLDRLRSGNWPLP